MTARPKSMKYEPRGKGALAIAPEAFGFFFDVSEPKTDMRDGVAVVAVHGPLMHHEEWFFDSYDAIAIRVLEALEAAPKAVVLSIDSPGGLVSGCFENADQIRELCARAGVPLYAYVDGQATSAAYALACAADHIVAPATAMVGSIGVLCELMDHSESAAKWGTKVHLVTSGARKGDGHPLRPITDGALAAIQKIVDAQASVFFEHVGRARGIAPGAVEALEAAQMTAPAGMAVGLVDEVSTLDQLLAAIASGTVPKKAEEKESMTTKASKSYEDAIAALRKCAEGDDEESGKAKRMLKAELEEDDAPATPDEPDEEKPDEEEAKAEDKAEESTALDARVSKLEAEQKAAAKATADAAIASERAQLIAGRPDLAPELVAIMSKDSTPIETVRDMAKTLPRGKLPNPAAAAQVTGTRGAGQGAPTKAAEPNEMDVAMGLHQASPSIHHEAGRVVFPTMTPASAAKAIAERKKEREAAQ